MLFSKKRIIKHKYIFTLLAVSFIATLLVLQSFFRMRSEVRHAVWVQEQCEFQMAYTIATESMMEGICYVGIDLDQGGKEWEASMPEIMQGILTASVEYEETDDIKQCLLQYIWGDYTQIHFPLADGNRISLRQGEKAFYIGKKFLPDVIEKNGDRFLKINGELIKVTGILDDNTGKGADDRLLLFGRDTSEEMIRQLKNNLVLFRYYCDSTEKKEEFERFADWLSKKNGETYLVVQEWPYSYTTDSFFVMSFVEKAIWPIIFCCICNCLLIMQVYIRKMKHNLYIRRMCGMSWLQLSCLIGADYGIILIPAAVLIGIINRQAVPILLGSVVLLIMFTFLSLNIIKHVLNAKGRHL